ncbi:hypothetical protein [Halomarina pelagica]|uniref:hypothetical protein n=1 Tax=Halomarina pelagica TaxID=2961599 RepID=UPI0020C4CBB5|nr:hypothetical protein [Halomarina sp. BND7]
MFDATTVGKLLQASPPSISDRAVWLVASLALFALVFAVGYVVLRFAFVGVAAWSVGDVRTVRRGAKVLAFVDALTVALGVAGIGSVPGLGVPLLTVAGLGTVLGVLACGVYRFERALAARRAV